MNRSTEKPLSPAKAPFPDRLFLAFLRREPTEKERNRMLYIRSAFNLRENDSFFAIILTLEFYQATFKGYHEAVRKETSKAEDVIRGVVREELRNARPAPVKPEANNTNNGHRLLRLLAGLYDPVFIALIFAALLGSAAQLAYRAGYGDALSAQVTAAAWPDTPDGRAARRLAQARDIQALAACSKSGWETSLNGTHCMVYASQGGLPVGWRLK